MEIQPWRTLRAGSERLETSAQHLRDASRVTLSGAALAVSLFALLVLTATLYRVGELLWTAVLSRSW